MEEKVTYTVFDINRKTAFVGQLAPIFIGLGASGLTIALLIKKEPNTLIENLGLITLLLGFGLDITFEVIKNMNKRMVEGPKI